MEMEELTAEELEELTVELQEECQKKKASNKEQISDIMDNTRASRRRWIVQDKPHSSAVFETFPPLKDRTTEFFSL